VHSCFLVVLHVCLFSCIYIYLRDCWILMKCTSYISLFFWTFSCTFFHFLYKYIIYFPLKKLINLFIDSEYLFLKIYHLSEIIFLCFIIVFIVRFRKWDNKSRGMSEFGIIIDECKRLLALNLNCKVNHVQRQANWVARELAQATHFTNSPQVFNYCPSCIEPIIMNEMY
jgi:hypothetical protein